MEKPDFLAQGEPARLFSVLSTTSKEGRTTSIVLACLSKIDEFGKTLLASIGQRVGKRSRIETFTEVVFKGEASSANDRPDGLIVVQSGAGQWKALVEAKIGNATLNADQVERYRALAKQHDIDSVITISNQFATLPTNHPIAEVRKSRSRVPVYHWSWMFIFTKVDLLLSNEEVGDADQALLLEELRRFLVHESAGVKGFRRMPPEWTELNRQISAGARVAAKSPEAHVVLDAWHQETKDLSLILSRQTETHVQEKLSRKHAKDPTERLKDELHWLRNANQLRVALDIPNAAAPLEVVADITRRTVDVGMTLRAPEDRKSSKARLNWLLRQIRTEERDEIYIRLNWPGRSEATQFRLAELLDDPALCDKGKEGQQVWGFHVFVARHLGARFTQQSNFISELEEVVPRFYREVGQDLTAWRKAAPRIKDDPVSTADAEQEVASATPEERPTEGP